MQHWQRMMGRKGGGVIKLDQTPFSIPHIAVLLVLHTLIIQTRRYTM